MLRFWRRPAPAPAFKIVDYGDGITAQLQGNDAIYRFYDESVYNDIEVELLIDGKFDTLERGRRLGKFSQLTEAMDKAYQQSQIKQQERISRSQRFVAGKQAMRDFTTV